MKSATLETRKSLPKLRGSRVIFLSLATSGTMIVISCSIATNALSGYADFLTEIMHVAHYTSLMLLNMQIKASEILMQRRLLHDKP